MAKHTARFLKYVWPFYNIMHERVKLCYIVKGKLGLLTPIPYISHHRIILVQEASMCSQEVQLSSAQYC